MLDGGQSLESLDLWVSADKPVLCEFIFTIKSKISNRS
jgi:hypothetical protein